MTPEEFIAVQKIAPEITRTWVPTLETYRYYFDDFMIPDSVATALISSRQQLQAETQRADKAEEMVEYIKKMQFESYEARTRSEIPISVYHQKLCAEIVGKIEGQQQFLFKKDDPAFVQDYDCGKQVAWNFAIDIVKSVLKAEG